MKGNPHFRLGSSSLKMKLPHSGRNWIKGQLKLFGNLPLYALICFSIQLEHIKGRKFRIHICWAEPEQMTVLNAGTIGIDTNPDLLALSDLDGHGNLLHQHQIHLPRVTHAKQGKRQHDILMAAKAAVAIAVRAGKSITIEILNYGKCKARPKGQKRNKRFNRMRRNFCYRQILTAIKREATKAGVPIIEVFAGYTSVLGIHKFAKMYSLNRHTAAAICIGRRGIGIIKERQNFVIETIVSKKDRNRGNRLTLRQESSDSSRTKLTTECPKGKAVCARLRLKAIVTLQDKYLRGCPTQKSNLHRLDETTGIISPQLEPGLKHRHIVASGKGNRTQTKSRPSLGEAVP